MNSSELRKAACSYLGFYGEPTEEMIALVDSGMEEARALAHFRAVGKGNIDVVPILAAAKECGVRCLHLMPLLDSPAVNNDGGYAVSDFTRVKDSLGTMADLKDLAEECHRRKISVCLD